MAIQILHKKQTTSGIAQHELALAAEAEAGHLLVLFVGQTGSITAPTIEDNKGASGWTIQTEKAVGAGSTASLFWAMKTAVGGETEVKVKQTGRTIQGLSYFELSGASTNVETAAHVSNVATGKTVTSPEVTTVHANDLLIGCVGAMGGSTGTISAWTGQGPLLNTATETTRCMCGHWLPGKPLSGATFTANWNLERETAMLVVAIEAEPETEVELTPKISGGLTPPPRDIRARFPLHLTIGGQDYTSLLSDGFTFSNADPGGFEMASFPVPKDLPQVIRGMNVRLTCNGSIAWEGRVKEIQRSLGAKTLIQCEGYGALLKDQDISMVFVDRDLSRWKGPSVARQKQLIESNSPASGSNTAAPGGTGNEMSLIQAMNGTWVEPILPRAEAWYDAGPQNLIAVIYYAITWANAGGANWSSSAYVAHTNGASPEVLGTANLAGAGGEKSGYFEPASHWRWALLYFQYGITPAGKDGEEYQAFWKHPAVYGNHGITGVGETNPHGLGAASIAQWLVTGSPVPIEGLEPGIIEEPAGGYVVPHLAYYTPVEGQQVLADLAKLTGNHWGVWESFHNLTGEPVPRLDFRPHPAHGEATAWVWRHECQLVDVREDITSQYNKAHVSFTDASGEPDVAEVTLANPVLEAAEIGERTINLTLGTSTPAAAEAYGLLALESFQHQGRVLGTASIKEAIHKPSGAEFPPWLLKAGIDRLRIPDLPSADAWGTVSELPITRVEATVDTTGITTQVEFGLGPNLVEVLTARLQEATFGDVV